MHGYPIMEPTSFIVDFSSDFFHIKINEKCKFYFNALN